jgi:K+-transporting ATPase KdpF subunit
MKTKILTSAILMVVVPEGINESSGNNVANYIIGSLIALYLLGYIFYSLRRPEEF